MTTMTEVKEGVMMGEIRIMIADDIHRDLKRIAIDESKNLKEVIEDALISYIGNREIVMFEKERKKK